LKKRIQVQFSLYPENTAYLKELSDEYDRPMSEILRAILIDFKERRANGKSETVTGQLQTFGSDVIKDSKGG
jgi:hypothetical protein